MKIDANTLEVNIGNVKENIKILKKITNKKFFAVVKANAYGLGAVEISKKIENLVDMFCVANINEAIELRDAGISKDILILGYVSPLNYEDISNYDLILNIYNFQIAKEIEKLKLKIRCHLKIETGHNRLGFQVNSKSLEEIRYINSIPNINIEGIFTHFSSADEEDNTYTNNQEDKFRHILLNLKDISRDWIIHSSNDAAAIAYNFNSDAIRSGICIYGVYPSDYIEKKYNIGIKSVFEWKSKVSNIKIIESGEAISYGRKFISKNKMKVATVSIGYADGYKMILRDSAYVLINGKKAKILGNITMDQIMVDITDNDVNIHDEVVLIGKSGNQEITVSMFAKWAKTIPYEIMTSISSRVIRTYIEENNIESK